MSATMTARQKRKYVASNGTICPACQSKDIRVGIPKTNGDEVKNIISCNACNESWVDTYQLIDVRFEHEDIDEPKQTPLTKETPVIFYFRFHRKYGDRKGGLTVVFNPVTRRFGVSRCNTGNPRVQADVFSKYFGRAVAIDRSSNIFDGVCPPWHPTLTAQDEDMTMERIREMAENIAWRLRYY